MADENSGAPAPSPDAEAGIDVNAVLAKWSANDGAALFTKDSAEPPETPAEPAPPAPVVDSTPAPETAETPAQPPSAPQLTDQQLQALSKKEEALLAAQQELKQAKEQLQALQQFQMQLKRDPVAALKAQDGIDPGLIGVQLLAEDMGDAAPEEFKTEIRKRAEQARLDKLEADQKSIQEQVAAAAKQAAFQTQVTLLDRDLVGTIHSVPENMPFLKRLAAKNPEDAYRGMAHIAAEAVKQGRWPSAQEIAKALDAGLKADYESLAPETIASNETPPVEQETRQTPTISDAEAAERPRHPVDPDKVHDADYYQKRALAVVKQMGGLIKD